MDGDVIETEEEEGRKGPLFQVTERERERPPELMIISVPVPVLLTAFAARLMLLLFTEARQTTFLAFAFLSLPVSVPL